jgi:hypothetical protein
MRRYAQDTSVAVSKSRSEIDTLLRQWGANALQWSDDFTNGKVTLRFVWRYEEADYLARFVLELPSEEQIKAQSIDRRSRRYSQNKFNQLVSGRGRSEHRILLLWLKAALNAVDSGIVSAETLFLPWLEGKDGRTVAEVAVPHLERLMSGSAMKLLGAGL